MQNKVKELTQNWRKLFDTMKDERLLKEILQCEHNRRWDILQVPLFQTLSP